MTAPHPFDVVSAPFDRGIALVEASAGTGKTFNIALSVVRLLLEGDDTAPVVRGVGRILVVTFTNAATDELINRIRRVLRLAVEVYSGVAVDEQDGTVQRLRAMADQRPWARARVEAALASVDTLSIFTIHGFAKRVLDEFALESGTAFGATLLEDEDELVREAMQDWWRRTFYDNPGLARYAVAKGLTADAFLADYRTWANWPGAVLAPDLTLGTFDRELHAAVQAFAAAWRADDFAARAEVVKWNKGAPCATADQIAALDTLVVAARTMRVGDPALLHELAPAIARLCTGALHAAANKQGAKNKLAAEGVRTWPEASLADRVATVEGRLAAALRADCLRATATALQQEKTRRQAVGFGDLLTQLHGVLTAQGDDGLLARTVRAQFDAAMIDEFQDTDAFQFDIFTTIFRDRPLFLIGDPKQAIYGFRGADVRAYLAAAKAAPAARRYTLQQNFRSTRAMVEAVNTLFAGRREPFLQAGIGYPVARAAKDPAPPAPLPGGHALEITWLASGMGGDWWTVGEAQRVSYDACVRGIVDLLSAGWEPRQLAVLVRAGYEGRAIERLLRAAGVPAVVAGMDDVFQSAEMAELQLVLQAIAAPRHATHVRAALATGLWGLGHDDLLALLAPDAEADWEALLDTIAGWRARWATDGLVTMLDAVFAERRVMERWLPLTDGDRRVTNLRHAVELVQRAAVEQHLNIEGVLRWLASERSASHTDRDATELRLETDAAAVQIVTIHKSKGLEYDIVFCPTLWNARLTGETPVLVPESGHMIFEHGSDEAARRIAAANAGRLAEDLRLLYVALTRARYRTIVTWGAVVAGNARTREARLETSGSIHSAFGYLLANAPSLDEALPLDDGTAAADAMAARARAAAEWLHDHVGTWPELLQAFAERSGGRVAMCAVQGVQGTPRWTPPAATPFDLACRTLPGDLPLAERFRTYQITSYTALTSRTGAAAGGRITLDDDHADRDVDVPDETALEAAADRLATLAALRLLPRDDFRAFPAGAREGTVLHELFEQARFDEPLALLRARAARSLVRQQLAVDEADGRIDGVAQMMTTVFATPFVVTEIGTPVRLREVDMRRTRHEWQFTLPLATSDTPLTARGLAEALERAGTDAVTASAATAYAATAYAATIRNLPIRRVHGFLQGFVDLLCEHEGRWYVVDWKSNRLGLEAAAYAPAALAEAMDAHHYTLQAHLYLLAVHRFLRTRLPDYDYDRHVGGAAYAFLRGFTAGAGGDGWTTLRPSRAVIDALDGLVGGAAGLSA